MPVISFVKPRPPLAVSVGANLMQSLVGGGLPVASSCGGDGVCAKCRITIIDDSGPVPFPSASLAHSTALSPENDDEKFLRERHSIPREQRVSCQVAVLADITVDTSYW